VKSVWPPAELVVTALEANVEEFVYDHQSRTSLGRVYIERIAKDLSRLDAAQRKRARAGLERFTTATRTHR